MIEFDNDGKGRRHSVTAKCAGWSGSHLDGHWSADASGYGVDEAEARNALAVSLRDLIAQMQAALLHVG